jgi:hypothetical protein
MSRQALLMTLVLSWGLVGCGPSPVAVCAGNHAGTFDGYDSGTLEATLNERGKADITLSAMASGTLESSGKVDRDGSIETSGFVSIEGTLDLATCESGGTWSGPFGVGGTWSMAPQ